MSDVTVTTHYNELEPESQATFRNTVKSMLTAGPVEVVFLKTDGSQRVMCCTLQEGIAIPHAKTTDREKKQSDEVCPVWDIDKNAWRSFRYDSIIEVTSL